MTTTLELDLRTRMVPSAQNVADAKLVLADGSFEMALTAIMFPGKDDGWWDFDTVVETADPIFGCNNDDSYYVAMSNAEMVAAKALGERPGTVGYVVHSLRDGEVASSVFESIVPPLEILARADRKAGAR